MELEEGFAYAAQGRAVLFLGAGFSWGATSLSGEPFLLGASLGKALANEMGVPEGLALHDLADMYQSTYGSAAFLSKLRHWYTAKDVSRAHRAIAKLDWRAVYTTNYDDVFERACAEVGRQVVSLGGADPIGRQTKTSLYCIHLNGFIRDATEYSLSHELKLTTTSYAAGSAVSTEWTDRFRFDLHAAQAIFFVGYSLADLDLRRILTAEELKDKSFFVLKENPDIAEAHRANLYGLAVAKGVDAFADDLTNFLAGYSRPPDIAPLNHCFKQYLPISTTEPLEDRYLFELLLSGKLRNEFVAPSYLGQVDYCGVRDAVLNCASMLRPGVGIIYITSSLGNGKTVALAELKFAALAKGFSVFTLSERGYTLQEELHHIMQQNTQPIVFVGNYPEWLDLLHVFRGRIGTDLTLILSARTASHDALAARVADTLGFTEAAEFNLDHLTDDELQWTSHFLDHFGFWHSMAGSGEYAKAVYLK